MMAGRLIRPSGGSQIRGAVVGPTHEREITEPVDLATSDGSALNPEAMGWSRTPMHRGNLRGRWGRESLNVVIPWSDARFQYTSKHQARPARGTLTIGSEQHHLDDTPAGAWGVLDVGRGRWPYRTTWNWGGGAGQASPDGPVVGIQVGGRWTEGTGFTENGILVDGRLTKIGTELAWEYDWARPMQPWTVTDPSGHLDLTLDPRFDKHSKTSLVAVRTETHQVFGTWSGHIVDDAGTRIELHGIQGFAEESRSRW
jgi:hypothetical protein